MPVRFTEGQAAALKRIAAACGVGYQDVARWAVEALGAYWEAHGQRLLLPLDFRQRFTVRQEPMILQEPPNAQPKSGHGAGSTRTNTPRRKATARV
jgi:hypothetical protein